MKRYCQVVSVALGFAFWATSTAGFQTGAGTISGRVLLPDGSPFADARVAVLEVATANRASLMSLTQSDRDGRYRLTDVPPGRYYIVVGRLDDPMFFPGVSRQVDATVITVSPGATIALGDFRMKAPFTVKVSGRVIHESLPTGAQVVLDGKDLNNGAPYRLATAIAPDGSFQFGFVRPGLYSAYVEPHANVVPANFVVGERDITELQLTGPVMGTLSFTMVVENGGPLPSFQLKLVPGRALPVNSPRSEQYVRLPQGTAPSSRVPLSEYRVSWPDEAALPPGYFIKSIVAGPVDLMKGLLKVNASGNPPVEITVGVVSPLPWTRLVGRVTGIEQAAVRAQQIAIFNDRLSPLTASVGPDGSFEFPMALPGTYQAILTPAADAHARLITFDPSSPVTVEVPMTISSFEVSGRLFFPNGPLDRAVFVRLEPELTGDAYGVFAASNGSFRFIGIPPGKYRLMLRSSDSTELVTGKTMTTFTRPDANTVITVTDRNVTDLQVTVPNVRATR